MRLKIIQLIIGLLCLASARALGAEPIKIADAHTQIELVSEVDHINPGQSFWVAIRMAMEDGWHIYWNNPGDSGAPPKITWHLPQGLRAGPFEWPFPKRIDYGDLTSYGYSGEVFFLTEIFAPSTLTIGEPVMLSAHVDWLACEKICVPAQADIALSIPVTADPPAQTPWHESFEKTRQKLPIHSADWIIRALQTKNYIHLTITPAPGINYTLTGIQFFPHQADVINHVAQQNFTRSREGYELLIEKSSFRAEPLSSIQGLLVAPEGWRGPQTEQALEVDVPVSILAAPITSAQNSSMGVVVACLFAFLGGLILNLMPCVLPVLSIKVLQLIQHLDDRRKSRLNALVFASGIIVSFWALAGILILFKTAGAYVGWGFQFQSPIFVAIILSLLFLLGLNLFGVFELAVSIKTKGGAPQTSFSYSSAFVSGVLTTIVATPCTAPFMGTAIGYALAQPNYVAFLVFTFLGFGLAFPYILLTSFPRLLKWVPKPGPWMITLKSIFGFVLMGCVIWLLWVLAMQSGEEALVNVLIGLFVIALGAWGLGHNPSLKGVAIAIILIGFLFNGFQAKRQSFIKGDSQIKASSIEWFDYSPQLIEKLRLQHQKIFIDFTASWCLTCQVNERLVFNDERVIQKIKELKIMMVKADWTNRDEVITQALANFGKSSIPLYVLFSSDASKEPIILPEIITPGIVLKVLDELN